MEACIRLSVTQQQTLKDLLAALSSGSIVALRAKPGFGRTAILRKLHLAAGGAFVGFREFMNGLIERQPASIEEAFLYLIDESLEHHDLVVIDDLHLLNRVVEGCYYPRAGLLDAVLTAILDDASARGKTLLFGVDHEDVPQSVGGRAQTWQIAEFTPKDYEHICRAHLDSKMADHLDYRRIHRFAPLLNIWQLKNACTGVKRNLEAQTDAFIEYLSKHNIVSNVEIKEVHPVSLCDLKGIDELVKTLETKIALPFENDHLASELGLKPRRGVLLAGPPGTGKTTIGRALAHRLKGKFFLIDGTVIAGTGEFYQTVRRVFDTAKRNAPSVIFIDDTDLIFEGDEDRGFYRYLLTMLDGLESASAERVCVVMTAMDANSLPPALLRSGRVELWLETRLPDAEARAAIICEHIRNLPDAVRAVDVSILTSASNGLTGADLKAVIEDGKLLFAYDKANGKPLRPMEEYFLEAIETVRRNRRNYGRKKTVKFGDALKVGFASADSE